MKILFTRFGYFMLFLSLCFSCEKEKQNNEAENIMALKNATIYDGNGNTLENTIILIQEGIILDIINSVDDIPKSAEILNLEGKYIMPGMVDAHMHFFQTGFFDARPDALDLRDSLPAEEVYDYQKNNPQRYYDSYLRAGVTAVYDVGDFNFTLDLNTDGTNIKPHIASAGPLLTPVPREYIAIFNRETDSVMIPLESPEIGINHVKKYTDKGSVGIKIWSLNLRDSIFMKSLRAVSKVVIDEGNQLIVHATSLDQAKAALRLNTKLLVHSVQDTLVDDEFLALLNKENTYYNPTLIVGKGYYNTYKAVLGEEFKINDPNGIVDLKTKSLLTNANNYVDLIENRTALENSLDSRLERLNQEKEIMAENLKRVYHSGAKIVVGTDAGNPGTLHGISIYDELEAMQEAGLPAEDIIVMATKNGAEIMKIADKTGTIEKGKLADLIILNSDPAENIKNVRDLDMTIREGKIIDVKTPIYD